ncbi:MAG: hypothetical protein AB7F95_03155 [Burkholderiales bacterium]
MQLGENRRQVPAKRVSGNADLHVRGQHAGAQFRVVPLHRGELRQRESGGEYADVRAGDVALIVAAVTLVEELRAAYGQRVLTGLAVPHQRGGEAAGVVGVVVDYFPVVQKINRLGYREPCRAREDGCGRTHKAKCRKASIHLWYAVDVDDLAEIVVAVEQALGKLQPVR